MTDLLGSGLKKYREPEWVDEVQLKQEIEKNTDASSEYCVKDSASL